ncbi:MAG TPA: FkbM family methyltransferase [Thermoanaerobaculia bacterium]|nr:FkbM family methyltransferase [Thermoanaerobaculia bacterium]
MGKRLIWRSASGLPQSFREISLRGVRLRVPYSLTHDYIAKDFEPETVAVLCRLLRAGDRVVDVGATIGAITCLAASRVGPAGEVWAIEPDPANIAFLGSNIALNELPRVRVVPAAAGASTGTVELYQGGTGVTSSLVRQSGLDSVRVPLVTLDSLRIETPVDLIKIDVEGAELAVLEGARETIRRSPQITLVVEWNPAKLLAGGLDPLSLPAWLEGAGFEFAMLDGGRGDIDAATGGHP